MQAVEAAKPAPSKVWPYVLVGFLGVSIRYIGKELMHAGWGRWPDFIAAAITFGLLNAITQDTWQKKLKRLIETSLFITGVFLVVFAIAPFLSNYVHPFWPIRWALFRSSLFSSFMKTGNSLHSVFRKEDCSRNSDLAWLAAA